MIVKKKILEKTWMILDVGLLCKGAHWREGIPFVDFISINRSECWIGDYRLLGKPFVGFISDNVGLVIVASIQKHMSNLMKYIGLSLSVNGIDLIQNVLYLELSRDLGVPTQYYSWTSWLAHCMVGIQANPNWNFNPQPCPFVQFLPNKDIGYDIFQPWRWLFLKNGLCSGETNLLPVLIWLTKKSQ